MSARRKKSGNSSGAGIWLLFLLLPGPPSACQGSRPTRGDCEVGYLKIDGKCVLAVGQGCTRNGDCTSDICFPRDPEGNFCTIGCQQHADCPAGFYCPPESGRCLPGRSPLSCASEADCGPCRGCEEGECRAKLGCRACSDDAGCYPCQRCVQSACVAAAGCAVCAADADCPQACTFCDANRECRKRTGCLPCQAQEDCPGCTRCARGGCEPIAGCGVTLCAADPECPPRTRCLGNASLGYKTCLPAQLSFGADCSLGGKETCSGGSCVTTPGGSFCSQPCQTDDGCPSTTRCLPYDLEGCLPVCRAPELRLPADTCLHDADCPQGKVCGLYPDEPAGAWRTRCLDRVPCARTNGEPCDATPTGRCASAICSPQGLCTPVCSLDADCPAGRSCQQLFLPLPGGTSAPFHGCG